MTYLELKYHHIRVIFKWNGMEWNGMKDGDIKLYTQVFATVFQCVKYISRS